MASRQHKKMVAKKKSGISQSQASGFRIIIEDAANVLGFLSSPTTTAGGAAGSQGATQAERVAQKAVSNTATATANAAGDVAKGVWSHFVGDFKNNRGKWVVGSMAALVLIGGGLKLTGGGGQIQKLALSAVAPEAGAASAAMGGAHAKLRARSPVIG